jgi:hypothetical protein
MLRRLIGEDIRLDTVFSPDLGRIQADPGQLHQVLMNLAVNARDAMPGGGNLFVETENVNFDSVYPGRHPEIPRGRYVQVTVSDTGIGMGEDVMAHLFEPFFTTKKQGDGTGLGLATVYGIIKQSGGWIWAYSEPGHGTTFRILLPRVEEEVSREEVSGPDRESLRGTETILVVEDQDDLRKMAQVILESYGYRVLEAANAGEALLHSERYAGPIQLMLADVVMPGMTGPELADRLRALRPEMAVVFMSGYSETAITDRGILDVSDSYLTKPFSPEALAAKVRKVLGPPRPAGTVLVVDDEAGFRSLLQKILSGVGYAVLEASDGEEALQVVRACNLDLVLTDLSMPVQDGLETIKILRQERPELKIIAVSGRFGAEFLRTAELLGARASLTKPIRPDELLETVRRVMLT